jgi:ribosome-binding factor A
VQNENVTVLNVEVAGDVRSAKVYVSVMGDEKVQALTMRGLKAARGFIQSKVAERLQTRNTPILTFILDQGVKKSIAAAAVIRQALAETAADAPPVQSDADSAAENEPSDEHSGFAGAREPGEGHDADRPGVLHPDPGESGP